MFLNAILHQLHGNMKKFLILFICVQLIIQKRSKRLTPKLFKEMSRLVYLNGMNVALSTCASVLPVGPFGKNCYYHYPINIDKLLKAKFWFLEPKQVWNFKNYSCFFGIKYKSHSSNKNNQPFLVVELQNKNSL